VVLLLLSGARRCLADAPPRLLVLLVFVAALLLALAIGDAPPVNVR
jgi:hypothetical protein